MPLDALVELVVRVIVECEPDVARVDETEKVDIGCRTVEGVAVLRWRRWPPQLCMQKVPLYPSTRRKCPYTSVFEIEPI